MLHDDPKDPGSGLLCAGMIEYPIWIAEGAVEVRVDREEDLPAALSEFTRRFFGEVMKRPGVELDPRAFLRSRTSPSDKRPRSLCPFSYPAETWVRLAIEQVTMDTSGMQVRYLRNDLPWLEQPAVYTDVVQVVQNARGIAQKWIEERKKSDNSSTRKS